MHDEPKTLFRQAIINSLPHLQPLVGQFFEECQVWQKVSDSQWSGKFETRPAMTKVFREARKKITEASAAFSESFPAHHPEYAGMVGFRGSQQNWANNHSHIVRSGLQYLWRRHKTFELTEAHVDPVVQEFADFVDSTTVRLKFQSQLLNFKMSACFLQFPDGVTIRRLGEEEVSQFHGGPISTLGFIQPRTRSIQEFILEAELDEPKLLRGNGPAGIPMAARAKPVLDKAVLSLRTFKEGPVGYDYIWFRPITFCPIGFLNIQGAGDKYVPFGSYSLSVDELEPLTAHAKLIFDCAETAMEKGCSRLADAESRTRPQDRIVDAVIGMEALLLANIQDRKGELSFRFSLNYAMLFPAEERQSAYRVARDLYNLRSAVVHGSAVDENKLKLAGERMTLPEAARRATSALRTIIMRFLPTKIPQYKNPEFWQRAYFGLSTPHFISNQTTDISERG